MGDLLEEAIAIWEGEGGALPATDTTPISAGNPVKGCAPRKRAAISDSDSTATSDARSR